MIDTQSLPQVAPEVSLEALFDAGCHFGHQSKKWHPKMAPWIYAEQDGVHIFDLEKTAAQLQKAYNYAYQLGVNKKNLVVVGTKKQASELVEKAAQEAGAMYVCHRWMGGLVTNWEQVSKSVKRMNEIEGGLATGKFNDYTKYERTMMAKELDRLERFFGGLKKLKNHPDAVFIIDVMKEKNAVKELASESIPMMALIDSNSNPTEIDIPIPANDDAISSIQLVIEYVLAGYKAGVEGKKIAPVTGEVKAEVTETVEVEETKKAEAVVVTEEVELVDEKGAVVGEVENKEEVKVVEEKAEAKKTVTKKAAPKKTEKKPTAKKPAAKAKKAESKE